MSGGRWLTCIAVCVRLVCALAFLPIFLVACNRPSVPQGAVLVQGQAFPREVLDIISGSNDASGPLQGKMLVLNVWATWCPPCRSEMPGLDRLSRILDSKRFAVVGISVDTDTLLAAEFLVQHAITFSNYFDQSGKMTHLLGLKVYPETFVIASDRTLVRRITGLQDWASPDMVATIEGLYQETLRARVTPSNASAAVLRK
jgi:thiol-disulfide isomerase/thioredoxin